MSLWPTRRQLSREMRRRPINQSRPRLCSPAILTLHPDRVVVQLQTAPMADTSGTLSGRPRLFANRQLITQHLSQSERRADTFSHFPDGCLFVAGARLNSAYSWWRSVGVQEKLAAIGDFSRLPGLASRVAPGRRLFTNFATQIFRSRKRRAARASQ